MIARADEGHKARFGRLTFVRAAVGVFRRFRANRVEVVVDGDVQFVGRAMSVIVTNVAERSSSEFLVAPDALIDDGRLDVLIVRATSAWTSLRLVVALARGTEPRRADLVRASGAAIDVRWTTVVHGQIDGDPTGTATSFDHTAARGALTVMTPKP